MSTVERAHTVCMVRFITWDTGIVAALGLLLAYSLIIRRHKSLATLVSVYISYLVAATWGLRLAEFFSGQRVLFKALWIQANTSPVIVQSILMVALTFLLAAFIKLGGRRAKYSSPEIIFYAIATLALAVMFILSFMSPALQATAMHHSRILPYVFRWREWILGLPVLGIIFFGIYSDDD